MFKAVFQNICTIGFLFWVNVVDAAQFKRFGAFEIHYNAFYSIDIASTVAQMHQLPRDDNIAWINISIVKKAENQARSHRADIILEVQNLAGQVKKVPLREIKEKDALYYIGHFRFAHAETFRFNIEVRPSDDENQIYEIYHQQTFYGQQ